MASVEAASTEAVSEHRRSAERQGSPRSLMARFVLEGLASTWTSRHYVQHAIPGCERPHPAQYPHFRWAAPLGDRLYTEAS